MLIVRRCRWVGKIGLWEPSQHLARLDKGSGLGRVSAGGKERVYSWGTVGRRGWGAGASGLVDLGGGRELALALSRVGWK